MGRLTVAVLLLGAALGASASATPLRNGRFTERAGDLPTGWRLEAWARDLSDVGWEAVDEGRGAVRIVNRGPNDARLCQPIAVVPGATYRVSARVKTEGVGLATAGALIALEPRVADSTDVKGTQDWQRLEVTATNRDAASWDVCLRLGSYANLNTGTAWFTDVEVEVLRGGVEPSARRFVPSLAPFAAAVRSGGWAATALPVVGGLLLAFGLGVVGRRGR
jgi:hypothetical protein